MGSSAGFNGLIADKGSWAHVAQRGGLGGNSRAPHNPALSFPAGVLVWDRSRSRMVLQETQSCRLLQVNLGWLMRSNPPPHAARSDWKLLNEFPIFPVQCRQWQRKLYLSHFFILKVSKLCSGPTNTFEPQNAIPSSMLFTGSWMMRCQDPGRFWFWFWSL